MWSVSNETLNNAIRTEFQTNLANEARRLDRKLQMRIEKGGGGIQCRSQTGIPWTTPEPPGVPHTT